MSASSMASGDRTAEASLHTGHLTDKMAPVSMVIGISEFTPHGQGSDAIFQVAGQGQPLLCAERACRRDDKKDAATAGRHRARARDDRPAGAAGWAQPIEVDL